MTAIDDLRGQLIAERYTTAPPSDPFTWWTPKEVAQHRAALAKAIGVEITNVRRLVDMHRRDQEVDWVAVERVVSGQWHPLTEAEKVEAYRWMHGHGEPYQRIQQRLRMSGSALAKIAREAS